MNEFVEWLNAKTAAQFTGVGVGVFYLLKYGQTLLDWILKVLDLRGERRHTAETTLRAELDATRKEIQAIRDAHTAEMNDLKDFIRTSNVNCSRVCDAYTGMRKKLLEDAEEIEKQLNTQPVNSALIVYILESWRELPPLEELKTQPTDTWLIPQRVGRTTIIMETPTPPVAE